MAASCALRQFVLLLAFFVCCTAYVVFVEPSESQLEAEGAMHEKRKKSLLLGLSETTEEVCKTRVRRDHQPKIGHIGNGSRVEIQQDEENNLVVTFVECVQDDRPSCHGVDNQKYSSECVTVYEPRHAYVRLLNTNQEFVPATVRVPIMCQCRLRRHILGFQKRRK